MERVLKTPQARFSRKTERAFPSGWWILPMAALGLLAWGVIIHALIQAF